MKNLSPGTGLALLGAGIALHPLVSSFASPATASSSSTTASALASVAATQVGGEPTVVWYGISSPSLSNGNYLVGTVFRAWSDGTVEGRLFYPQAAGGGAFCGPYDVCGQWVVFASPTQGFKAAADINSDEVVDGADLASVLSNWGDAPRVPFPPSNCPLNLVNP